MEINNITENGNYYFIWYDNDSVFIQRKHCLEATHTSMGFYELAICQFCSMLIKEEKEKENAKGRTP